MTVETLFHFRTGGELKWTVGGLLLGAVISVTPMELAPFLFPLPIIAFHFMQPSRDGGRSAHACFLAALGIVMVAALAAPLGPMDDRVELSATTLPLRDLAKELGSTSSVPDVEVALPSRYPTYREIRDAIEQQTGLRVRPGYCGNGANLLFGAAVIGWSLEPAR